MRRIAMSTMLKAKMAMIPKKRRKIKPYLDSAWVNLVKEGHDVSHALGCCPEETEGG